MKGIVLAGGKGSRLRPFTYSGAKQLVPIANTPVLHFPIRHLVDAGITDIAIIVGETGAQVCEAMGDGSAFEARFTYVAQHAPLGIAHAISLCRDFVGSEPFVVYLGDNVLHRGIVPFVTTFLESGAAASLVLTPVDDPSAFGVAIMDGERMTGVVEKPSVPPSSLAVTGVYAFTPAVFPIIEKQVPSARGELEIADTINGLIGAGHSVVATVTTDDWIDTGKMDDILAANRIVLADIAGQSHAGASLHHSTLAGPVEIAPGAELNNCRVVGPASIGPNTLLDDATVGPNVAIGADCTLKRVTIANAIVMERAALSDCAGIVDSMIGRDAVVCGLPAGSRLTLGDHSRIEGAR